MDPQTNQYLQYYKAQSGGQLNVFAGSRRAQLGGGLGDILRGIWRTLFPIAARGASTFLSETLKSRDSGRGWRDAAKAALAPTVQNVADSAVSKLSGGGGGSGGRRRGAVGGRSPQEGRGARRKRKRFQLKNPFLQAGHGRRRRRRRRRTAAFYKRAKSGTERKNKFLNF